MITDNEIKGRLQLIRRTLPECAWNELEGSENKDIIAGRFATMLDLVDDQLLCLIVDIKESIEEDKRLHEKWKAEREAREAERANE